MSPRGSKIVYRNVPSPFIGGNGNPATPPASSPVGLGQLWVRKAGHARASKGPLTRRGEDGRIILRSLAGGEGIRGGAVNSARAELAITLVLLAAVIGGVGFTLANLTSQPITVDYTSSPGQPVNVTMQTLGSYGHGIHATWVSYMTRRLRAEWLHTTIWQVPAHTKVNVTIYQYDSGSPLRNQQIGLVEGTIGNVATLNGKAFSVINSNAGNGVGHTFSMPSLGINVPLYGDDAEREPVRGRSLHHLLAAQRHQVLIHEPRPGHLSLAVFRPVWSRLPVRERWPDADGRLDGRLHEGGLLMPTTNPEVARGDTRQ